MRRHVILMSLPLLALLVPATAHAQLSVYKVPQPAIGERYSIEASLGWWNPDPAITIASDRLSTIGKEVDAVADLGITRQKFREYRIVVRPAKKHKVRFEYLPIKYEPEAVLRRTITFNDVSYDIGLPVNSLLDIKSYRFAYEWDFVYTDRAYLGVIGEVKYTKVRASIKSPVAQTSTDGNAPLPAVGGVARAYVARSVSVTGEFTAFKLPDSVSSDFSGRAIDFDAYATLNFSDNFGVQGGYRRLDITYVANTDTGDVTLKGLYVRGVVRF